MSLSIHCATSGGGHFGIRCMVRIKNYAKGAQGAEYT